MSVDPIQFFQFDTTSEQYQHACQLRNSILRQPLGLDLFNEDLSEERDQLHFGLIGNELLVGYVLIVPEQQSTGQISGTLRQMCIAPAFQGQGLGTRLIQNVEEVLIGLGFQSLSMSARVSAVGFYETLGYQCRGDQYLSVGIPHITMEKKLIPTA